MKITERLMAKKLYGQKKSVVEALDIKPTNYGYWITSNGEFIPVSSAFGHGATVSEYFPTSPTKREAMENGWIKVTHTTGYDSIAIQYHYQNVSKQAISNLVAFIREDMKEGRSFFFDYMIRDRGSVYPRTLTNYTDAIRNLRRFPETLKEAVDYPPAFYGYWITNSGEILPVNDGHEVSAELYMNQLGMDSSIFNILKMSATRYAIEGLGWVRIVTERHGIVYIDFMSETINHKVVLVLIDFLQTYSKDNRVFQYKIDVTEGMSFDEGKTDHADFDNLRQYLRRRRTPRLQSRNTQLALCVGSLRRRDDRDRGGQP